MQNAMRVAALALVGLVALAGAASAAGIFGYDRERQPISGDCQALAAELGPGRVWHGVYSGKRYDDFSENYFPYAVRGCFPSEFACRIWQNQAMTYAERGPTYYTRCRLGAPG